MDAGKIRMILERRQLNGLCALLTTMAEDEDANEFKSFSKYMLKKIKDHGRKFTDRFGNNKIAIHLYNNEAEVMLRLFSLCLTAAIGETYDYYDEIDREDTTEKKLDQVFM